MRRVTRFRRGVSTVFASLFFILIMFTLMILLYSTYTNYNTTIQAQQDLESARLREKIDLTGLELDETMTYVQSLCVSNTGQVEVRIRAMYLTDQSTTSFLYDPSSTQDTHIPPKSSLNLTIPTHLIIFQPDVKITVATERGVKTMQDEGSLIFGGGPNWDYDPSKLFIGPLMLEFDSFSYTEYSKWPSSPVWKPGWLIDTKNKIVWNITVKNIDVRNITLNRYSSFQLSPVEGSSEISWYLEPPTGQYTETLLVNQTRDIIFIWSAPKVFPGEGGSNQAQSANLPGGTRCMVFLTFFGTFERNGVTTPYAQTIPFEASVTTKK